MASVDPRKYVDLDFTRILGNRYDIALDTPIQYTWPYIVAQFPNARILHLTRNGTEWVLGRSYLQQALRPFGWAFEPNTDPRRHVKAGNAHQFANADGVIDALTFHAAESFVRCSVLREKYQEVPTNRLCAMQETLRAQLNCSRASCLVPDCNASGTRVGRSQYSPVKFMARQALLDAWHQE